MSSRSGQPIERGFLLDRRRVFASSRRFLSLPREGLVSGRRSRAGRREDVFGAPRCLRGVQGSVSGAEEGGVRVFQLAFAGLGRRGRRGLGVLPKFGSRGWLLVERPQAPSPPRRVRVLLDRRKRNLHHLRAHSGRLSGRRRDVHQLRVHALGRSGHLLELEDPRGKRLEEARGPRTTSEVEAVPRTARSDRSVDDIARRTSRAHRHPSSSASRVPLPRLSTYCGAPPGRLGIAEPSSFDLTLGRKYFPVTLLDAPGTPHGRPLPHR